MRIISFHLYSLLSLFTSHPPSFFFNNQQLQAPICHRSDGFLTIFFSHCLRTRWFVLISSLSLSLSLYLPISPIFFFFFPSLFCFSHNQTDPYFSIKLLLHLTSYPMFQPPTHQQNSHHNLIHPLYPSDHSRLHSLLSQKQTPPSVNSSLPQIFHHHHHHHHHHHPLLLLILIQLISFSSMDKGRSSYPPRPTEHADYGESIKLIVPLTQHTGPNLITH